jgi:phage repressor protein C with HTH and peptisase S24 domain
MSSETIKRFLNSLKENKISKSELARKIEVLPQVINSWITRKSIPIKHIERVAVILNTTPNYLISGDGSITQPISKKTNINIDTGDFEVFEATDDAMSPTINNGDYCLINPKNNKFKNGLYLYELGGQEPLQLIGRLIVLENEIVIKHDNEKYDSYPIKAKKTGIRIIGSVDSVWSHKKL